MPSFFRRVWRWHFWAGLLACPVLLVVAGTGALYTFRDELETWQQAELRTVPPADSARPLSEQLAAVRDRYPAWTPTRVLLPADPARSTIVQVDRPDAEPGTLPAVFVDPHTAAVIGDGDARSRFFAGVLKLHRSLFAGTTGRLLVELTTCWALVLLVTGLYLWLPAKWDRVRGVWLLRLTGPKYVVLRDLHAIGGLLFTPLIAAVAVTGLFFTVVWLWSFNAATNHSGAFPRELLAAPPPTEPPSAMPPISVDVVVDAARARHPADTLSIGLPRKPTDSFTVSARDPVSQAMTGGLAVDRYSGAILNDLRASELTMGKQARLLVLPVHQGSIGGFATKVLALLVCLALMGLAVSGVWMWLARRPVGRTGFPRASAAPVPVPAVGLILLLGVLFPVVGGSLLLVLAGEFLVGRLSRIREPNPVLEPQEVSL